MEIVPTRLEGLVALEPKVFGDARGFFLETFRQDAWSAQGIDIPFVQDNHSRSGQGVVRGMHFAIGEGQAKLIRCARGRIWDVVVDIRRDSPTFGEWEAFELDDESGRQLFIPVGFAHGFCVLSEVADVCYRCSSYYSPDVERGFAYDDPGVGIPWPQDMALLVSDRDRDAPTLAEIKDGLPF